jgi:hypothetical protein
MRDDSFFAPDFDRDLISKAMRIASKTMSPERGSRMHVRVLLRDAFRAAR